MKHYILFLLAFSFAFNPLFAEDDFPDEEFSEGAENREWTEKDWEAELPKPQFLDLHGYFRLRLDNFVNTALSLEQVSDRPSNFREPLSNSSANMVDGPREDTKNLAGANMRMRLVPRINVSEDIKIYSQLDVLDNVVLGSSPANSQNSFYSQSQSSYTSDRSAVLVKRAWAEVLTPLGEISFGRVPMHWGLGILRNSGDCLDCDYGTTFDTFQFRLNLFGVYLTASYDFIDEGKTYAANLPDYSGFLKSGEGQPLDADQLDDVNQVTLSIAGVSSEEEIQSMLEDGENILNWGALIEFRNQAYAPSLVNNSSGQPVLKLFRSDAELKTYDLWAKYYFDGYEFGFEFVKSLGSIKRPEIDKSVAQRDIDKTGLLANFLIPAIKDKLSFRFEYAYASGSKPESENLGKLSGINLTEDKTFMFSPDHHVDLILWRELLGSFSNAQYFKVNSTFSLLAGLQGQVDLIYSMANEKDWYPGLDDSLGFELDFYLKYKTADNFHFIMAYGLLVPLNGLGSVNSNGTEIIESTRVSPGNAQTLQALFGLSF